MKRNPKGITNFPQKIKYAGIHLIADFWGGKIIESPAEIKRILLETAKKSNNTPIEVKIHKFSPHGLTGFVLLAESHISIHTWPEMDYVAIDIFSCGTKSKPWQGLEYLKKEFKPKRIKVKKIKRG